MIGKHPHRGNVVGVPTSQNLYTTKVLESQLSVNSQNFGKPPAID
jgi:hypothetical protein